MPARGLVKCHILLDNSRNFHRPDRSGLPVDIKGPYSRMRRHSAEFKAVLYSVAIQANLGVLDILLRIVHKCGRKEIADHIIASVLKEQTRNTRNVLEL